MASDQINPPPPTGRSAASWTAPSSVARASARPAGLARTARGRPLRYGSAAVLGLAMVGCGLDSAGLGLPTPQGGDSSTGSPPSLEPSPTAMATTGEPPAPPLPPMSTGDPTNAEDSTGTDSTGAGESEGSTGALRPSLIDTGLLARWYIDEAGMGQAPNRLADDTTNPLDLELVYAGDSPQFTELRGHRGLRWSAEGQDGRALAPVAQTKLVTELEGSPQVTLELVVRVEAVLSLASRLLHIGTSTQNDLAVSTDSLDALQVRWDNTVNARRFAIDLDGQLQVIHVVIDTEREDPEDRVLAYVDGLPLDLLNLDDDDPAQGEGVSLGDASALVLGNRSDGLRSFLGQLDYAAIYVEALDPAEVMSNASVLLDSNDAPW